MSLELNECIYLKTCKNECKNNNKMDTSDLNAYINIINRFTNENQQFDDRIKCINFTMSYKEQKNTKMWSYDSKWVVWYYDTQYLYHGFPS